MTKPTNAPWTEPALDEPAATALAERLGVSTLLAQVLVQRGHRTPTDAAAFLRPDWSDLHDPLAMAGMEVAVERVRRALRERERILVFGDYDVDGISSVALLERLFDVMAHPVRTMIPDRMRDGYGLSENAAARILDGDPVDLVITVDCGVSDAAGVARLGAAGVDVIVTDHHVPPAELPPALAVVNPMRADCTYPFKRLAGVGVAFKFATAMIDAFSPQRRLTDELRAFLLEAAALATLGTVCDVVPLVDENRILVTHGLRSLAQSTNPGLRALIEVAGLAGRPLAPRDLGFKLGPRLNAAGRMGTPTDALELLTATSYQPAIDAANRLDTLNQRRQSIERSIVRQAERMLADAGGPSPRAGIVLAREGWSPGVLGIVASRLVDAHGVPVVLIGVNDGVGRGSGRSVPGFNLLEVVTTCGERLRTFGGHAGAIGLSVGADAVDDAVAALRAALEGALATFERGPWIDVDAIVPLGALRIPSMRELDRLAPFGPANRAPIFLGHQVRTAGPIKPSGGGRRQFRTLLVDDATDQPISALLPPSTGTPPRLPRTRFDVAYAPNIKSAADGRIEVVLKAWTTGADQAADSQADRPDEPTTS